MRQLSLSKENIFILKNSAILYVRLIFTSVLGLVASRFVIQGLGASDFGLYSVVGGIVVMMAFLNTVMASTTNRYISYEMGRGGITGVNKVFNISLVIHICLAVSMAALSESAGVFYINNYLNAAPGKIPDALFVLHFSTLATAFNILSIPYRGLVTAQEQFAASAAIEVIRSVMALAAATIIIFYPENQLRLYAVLVAAANAAPALLFHIYCRKNFREISRWKFQKDRRKYNEMIGFSGWILLGAAASVGRGQGSALIINAFFGTTLNAAFGIARQVNKVVLMFSQNLGQAAIPQIIKSYSNENTTRSVRLASHISKYTCFLMLVPSLPILLETDFLINLWLTEVPAYTTIFCQLMILNALAESLGAGIPAMVQASGKIKYFQIILSTTRLLSLPISYLLFKMGYPPYTILVTFILTALVNTVVRQILLKLILTVDIKYFINTTYLKIFYVAALTAPLFFIRNAFSSGFARFFLISSLSVAWLLLAIYAVGLESRERKFAGEVMNKIYTRAKLPGLIKKVKTYG